MITFNIETVDDVREDIQALITGHYKEIALNQDKIPLSPDYEKYLALEEQGIVRIATARDGGYLIGYFIVFLQNHAHYKEDIFAVNDLIYIAKEYRGQGLGAKMIDFVEADLKEQGVSVLMINTKVHQPFDKLMEDLNYELVERVYSKYLGDK